MKKIILLIAISFGISINAQTLEEAKELLEANSIGSAERTLEKVIQNESTNHEAHFLLSKLYLEKGYFNGSIEMINKAINLSPNNNDYHWIKVRASLRSNSSENDFKTAIDELTFIINNLGSSSKVFATLGFAYYEYAGKFTEQSKINSIRSNNAGLSDDDDKSIKVNQIYNEGIRLYELARFNYQKAIELKKEKAEDYGYKIKEIDNYISELKTKIR